jgi:hypothetical protein
LFFAPLFASYFLKLVPIYPNPPALSYLKQPYKVADGCDLSYRHLIRR